MDLHLGAAQLGLPERASCDSCADAAQATM